MKTQQILQIIALAVSASARTVHLTNSRHFVAREVPQEHSHEPFITSVRASLAMNNPAGIQDPIFGLLGDAAAAAGAGSITDLACLQQATADQAFTNAKAAGNTSAMVDALIFRALERNSGSVGATTTLCTSIQAANPEIAAVSQHQDPASTGAAATNKQIALDLAVQIASIGGDPQLAIKSGTFAPGTIGDPTAAGNTCDDANDPNGCIFTQNLLVPDVTAAEIDAAVAAGSTSTSTTSTSASDCSETPTPTPACTTATPTPTPSAAADCTDSTTSTSTTATTTTSTLDFGTCTGANPDIVFAFGFDGRTEEAFEPVDLSTFNHGSADGIGIITSFICQQLNDKCKASATTLAACASGSAAAAAASGSAAAAAFNAAFA